MKYICNINNQFTKSLVVLLFPSIFEKLNIPVDELIANDELSSKAIEYDNNFAMAYYNRGFVYLNKKQYALATEDFSKSLAIFPNDEIALNNRGIAYFSIQDYKSAVNDFSKAIEVNPRYADAYYNRGITRYHLKLFDDAQNDFIKAEHLKELINSSKQSHRLNRKIKSIPAG